MKKVFYCKGSIIFILLFVALGCSDEYLGPINSSKITIEEAKQWFENNIQLEDDDPQSNNGRTTKNSREPHWDFAKITRFKNKDVVAVPLKFSDDRRFSKSVLGKLIVSKDEKGKIQLQVLKAIGNSSYMKRVNSKIGLYDFTGIVEIQDWEGNMYLL